MATLNHDPVDLVQQLGRQQIHIVDQTLKAVAGFIELAIAQHGPNGFMAVGQFLEPVEITVQALLQNSQDQNIPQFHTRTTDIMAAILKHVSLEQTCDLVEGRFVLIEIL